MLLFADAKIKRKSGESKHPAFKRIFNTIIALGISW